MLLPRFLMNVVINTATIFTRAVAEAYRLAILRSTEPPLVRIRTRDIRKGITGFEAKKILGVDHLSKVTVEDVESRYKLLCEANKNGSKYIQEKIDASKLILDLELRNYGKKSIEDNSEPFDTEQPEQAKNQSKK
eukprot:TRINITY_DN1127_c0_g1_i1.p1 TRINITY_DN1127_c0_g1~~TRINITY_DN1127_c0_g1_i1.p1  ORF type:complete len:135 (-),score=15.52 TRINITY_DN1127_c0_g1_i1:221-625(-)